jgi:hypothetical protein
MLVDALLRRRFTADGVVAGFALVLYLISALAVLQLFIAARRLNVGELFPWAVLMLFLWTAVQWFRHRKAA